MNLDYYEHKADVAIQNSIKEYKMKNIVTKKRKGEIDYVNNYKSTK